LGVTQIPNPIYAKAIATAFQAVLQAAIAHHGILPNNPALVPISLNLYLQQPIVVIVNSPPTIDAPTFADQWGNSFEFLS
jgi:hypothetical protein